MAPVRSAVVLAAAAALFFAVSVGVAHAAEDAAGIDDVEQSLVRDPSYRVRVGAAVVLGRLARPRSVPVLLRALKDDVHPAVRGTAAQALGRIGDPVTRGALEAASQDGSPL